MRHRKKRLQLNRFTGWRKSTLISLARNLLIYQSIKTTRHRAYAVKPLVEKLISLGRQNSLAARRRAFRILGDHGLVSRLFGDIALRFNNQACGYTRILNLGRRRGDSAQLVILELTEIKKKEHKKPPRQEKEAKVTEEAKPQTIIKEKPVEEKKVKTETKVSEKPPVTKKPAKKFFTGLRSIFKKERDSL